MFKLMDFDNDGYLHPSDLLSTKELIDPESDFGEEVSMLMDYALHTLMKEEAGLHDKIDVHRYRNLNEKGRDSLENAGHQKF